MCTNSSRLWTRRCKSVIMSGVGANYFLRTCLSKDSTATPRSTTRRNKTTKTGQVTTAAGRKCARGRQRRTDGRISSMRLEGGHMLRYGDRGGDVGPRIVQKPTQKGMPGTKTTGAAGCRGRCPHTGPKPLPCGAMRKGNRAYCNCHQPCQDVESLKAWYCVLAQEGPLFSEPSVWPMATC